MRNYINSLELNFAKTSLSVKNKSTKRGFLEANYPNPFSNFTTIKYRLPVDTENARIIIKDMTGREVISKKLNIPSYKITCEESEFSAQGLYFYSLEINGKVLETKNLIFLK